MGGQPGLWSRVLLLASGLREPCELAEALCFWWWIGQAANPQSCRHLPLGCLQASGPTKWPRFAEFLRDAYGGAVRDLAARQEERQRVAAQQAQQAAEAARLQTQQVEARLASVESEVTQLRVSAAAGANGMAGMFVGVQGA